VNNACFATLLIILCLGFIYAARFIYWPTKKMPLPLAYFKRLLPLRHMQIQILKSKIHRATVTDANLNYVGSITIDEDLMDAAHLVEYEKVAIVNNNNGERFETYIITGARGSGTICLNGAAARKVLPGDIIIILSFGIIDMALAKNHHPIIVFPTANNRLT
jgi:aspartate 1-decarboxylase